MITNNFRFRSKPAGQETEELDTNAAFFTKVVGKKKKTNLPEAPIIQTKSKSSDIKLKIKDSENVSDRIV